MSRLGWMIDLGPARARLSPWKTHSPGAGRAAGGSRATPTPLGLTNPHPHTHTRLLSCAAGGIVHTIGEQGTKSQIGRNMGRQLGIRRISRSECPVLFCSLCYGRAGGSGQDLLGRSKYKLDPTPIPPPPIPLPLFLLFPLQRISDLIPLQRRIAILCVGRGGLVNPVGLELPAHRRRPPAPHIWPGRCASRARNHHPGQNPHEMGRHKCS